MTFLMSHVIYLNDVHINSLTNLELNFVLNYFLSQYLFLLESSKSVFVCVCFLKNNRANPAINDLIDENL